MSNEIIPFPGSRQGQLTRVSSIVDSTALTVLPEIDRAVLTPVVTLGCPICSGAGFTRDNVPVGHPNFGKARPCQCKTREINRRYASRTYTWLTEWVGDRAKQASKLESLSFQGFRERANGSSVAQAFQRARDYVLHAIGTGQAIGNVVLIGPYGVGKTHLACATLNEARAAGVGCLFVSGNDLFQAIFNSDFDEQILRQAINTPLLCLDDLDKMQKKEDGSFQKTTLFTLFEQRNLADRPTIITANEGDDWKEWVHPAVLSRLFGEAEVIEMIGRDYRLIGGK